MTTHTAQRRQHRDEQGRYSGRNESHYPSRHNYSQYEEDEDDFLDEDEEDDDDFRGASRYWGSMDDEGQGMNGDYMMNSSINNGRSYSNGTGDRSFNGYAPRNENYWAYSEHRGDQYPLPDEGYTSGYGSQQGRYPENDGYTRGHYSSRGGYSNGDSYQRNGHYHGNNDHSGQRSGQGRQGFAFNEHERSHGGYRSHNQGGVKSSANYAHSAHSNAYGTRGHGPVSVKHTRQREFERGRGHDRY